MTTDSTTAELERRGWSRFAVPSIGDVVFVVIFLLALAVGGGLTHRDGDLAKHLRLGQSILDDGQLPLVEVYSHTMTGTETVPIEWLSQTIFAAAERWFGFDGIGMVAAILIALPWLIMYRWLVKRRFSLAVSFGLVMLGAGASMIHWAARPHLFTWTFVVVWVVLLEDLYRGFRKQVWLLVPLSVLWINFHGGFFVGYILIGTYLIGSLVDRLRGQKTFDSHKWEGHLSLVLLATIAASLINPTGVRGLIHPFSHLLGDDFLFEFTREFTSPDFHNLLFWPFLVMILLTVAGPIKGDTTRLLLTASWTALGLYAFRNIPLYTLVVVPILARTLTNREKTLSRGHIAKRVGALTAIERTVAGGSISIVIVVLTVLSMWRSPGSDFDFGPTYFPIDALESFDTSPPGDHLFHQFVWGGYLVYCCHPEIPVFIDGQTDVYGPELTQEYDRAIKGLPGWRETFDQHQIDWVLISPDTGLAQALSEATDWNEHYRDQIAVVFVPNS